MSEMQKFLEGYLWGYLMAVSLPIGALGLKLVQILTKGKWAEPFEPFYQAATGSWIFILLLALPLALGFKHLYVWAMPHAYVPEGHLEKKVGYLNVPFFLVRFLFYFAVYGGITFWLRRYNQSKDISGVLAVIFVLTGTFAGVDWVMSLDPYWYSTIFGLMFIMGQCLLALCVMVLYQLLTHGPREPQRMVLRDQGNVMLTIVMLWAYLAFSQYLIIWMGNIPEEIRWYLSRVKGGWGIVGWGIIIGHFFVPFFLLLRRAWKENPFSLGVIALFVLIMRAVDMAWMVFPGVGCPLEKMSFMNFLGAAVVVVLYSWRLNRKIKEI